MTKRNSTIQRRHLLELGINFLSGSEKVEATHRVGFRKKRNAHHYRDRRQGMLNTEELILGLRRYGRENVQDVVARSQYAGDTLAYLRVEFSFELLRFTSFVTTNLVNFVKTTDISKENEASSSAIGSPAPFLLPAGSSKRMCRKDSEVCAKNGFSPDLV